MKDTAKKDDKSPMKAKAYMKELRRLQAELAYDDEAPMKRRRWIPEAY